MKKLFLFFTLTFLISCASKKEIRQDQTALNGLWELAEASYSKNLTKDYTEGLPTLNFDATEDLAVFGYDGCNRINTKAKLGANKEITVNPNIISTMMACNKVKDNAFTKTLTEATHYEVTGHTLKLYNEKDYLIFHKITLNGQWYLDKIYTTKSTVKQLYPYKKPFINLDILSTKFTGNTACNMITGMVNMYQNQMSFNHVTKTEMFCDGINEKIFIDTLNKITHFKLEGTRLILFQNDKKMLEFVRNIPQ